MPGWRLSLSRPQKQWWLSALGLRRFGRMCCKLEKQCRFADLQGVAGRQSYWNLSGLEEQEEKVFVQIAPKIRGPDVQMPKIGF